MGDATQNYRLSSCLFHVIVPSIFSRRDFFYQGTTAVIAASVPAPAAQTTPASRANLRVSTPEHLASTSPLVNYLSPLWRVRLLVRQTSLRRVSLIFSQTATAMISTTTKSAVRRVQIFIKHCPVAAWKKLPTKFECRTCLSFTT